MKVRSCVVLFSALMVASGCEDHAEETHAGDGHAAHVDGTGASYREDGVDQAETAGGPSEDAAPDQEDGAGSNALQGDATGPDAGGPRPAPAVGAPCTADEACPAGGSGQPVCVQQWPGGYCAVEGCLPHGHDCPGDAGRDGALGSKCVEDDGLRCLALCGGDSECREGYECVTKQDAAGHGGVGVCVPKG
jgi:hypothetical protein